jgi:pimeloyl-[acyl-carrier protein] methyl ester esterase
VTEFAHIVERGSGRPVVFLHGWSTDATFFAPQLALAEIGMRVLVPDLPGHGHDRRVGAALAIADLAAPLETLMARPDLAGAVLVGWSMGATVALDLLARRGHQGIAGLVMVDMTPKVANSPGWRLGLRGGQGAAEMLRAASRMEASWPAYAERVTAALFAPRLAHDMPLYRDAAAAVAANDGGTMASLWRSLVTADHRATLLALDIPVLALAGGESQLYAHDVAQWIAASAARGASAVIAGAGHAPQLEQPEAFNAAIAGFVRDLA